MQLHDSKRLSARERYIRFASLITTGIQPLTSALAVFAPLPESGSHTIATRLTVPQKIQGRPAYMGFNSEDYVGEPLVVATKMEIPSTRGGNALPQVMKEKIEMKRSILGVVAVYAFCFSSWASANFVYVNFGLAPGFLETGAITTSCDSCVLDSSRIVAWSFSNTSQSTPITSTDANAQILGNPENDLVATPQGVYFNFPDINPANIYFSSVNGEFQLVTAGGPYAAPFADDSGYYTVCLPGNQICTLGVLEFSTLQLGMLRSSTVPLPATIWLLLSALGSLGMWLRRTSSTPSGLCLASPDPRQKLERPHGT